MRKLSIIFLIAVFFVSTSPALLLAQGGYATAGDVCATAKGDASVDTQGGKILWYGAGCVLGVIGILLGYVITPAVPPNRLMGKSSEYVSNYSMCYQEQAKSEQGMAAIWGCVVGEGIGLILYFVLVASVFSSTAYWY